MEEDTKYRTVYDIYECAAKIIKHFGNDNQTDDIKNLSVTLDVKEKLEDLLKKIFPQKTLSQLLNIYSKSLVKKKIFHNDTDIAVLHLKNWNKARRAALSILKYAADNNINLPSVPVGSGSPYDFEKLQNWIIESVIKISHTVNICIQNIEQERQQAITEQNGSSTTVQKTPKVDTDKEIDSSTNEQPWRDDTSDYIPNANAIKMSGNKISAPNLSKLLRKSGNTIRWMQNKETRRAKVHTQDFNRYIKNLKTIDNFSDAAFEQQIRQEEIDRKKRL
jgi:hypothetical protein